MRKAKRVVAFLLLTLLSAATILTLWFALQGAEARIQSLEADLASARTLESVVSRVAPRIDQPVPPGSIQGWVTYQSATGRVVPAAGVKVRIIRAQNLEDRTKMTTAQGYFEEFAAELLGQLPPETYETIADTDGMFGIDSLPQGNYVVAITGKRRSKGGTKKYLWVGVHIMDENPSAMMVFSEANAATPDSPALKWQGKRPL